MEVSVLPDVGLRVGIAFETGKLESKVLVGVFGGASRGHVFLGKARSSLAERVRFICFFAVFGGVWG